VFARTLELYTSVETLVKSSGLSVLDGAPAVSRKHQTVVRRSCDMNFGAPDSKKSLTGSGGLQR